MVADGVAATAAASAPAAAATSAAAAPRGTGSEQAGEIPPNSCLFFEIKVMETL